MLKTVKVSCSKAPGGYFVQDADKVPNGVKLFKDVLKIVTKPKVTTKVKK
jgi:hypothetical protein